MIHLIDTTGTALEVCGVVIIAGGAVFASIAGAAGLFKAAAEDLRFSEFRTRLGRAILLGLEFLVAGDIIKTVAVTPTYRSVGILAIIVLIRTFLSFTLEVEMNGRWPWQNRRDPANEVPTDRGIKD